MSSFSWSRRTACNCEECFPADASEMRGGAIRGGESVCAVLCCVCAQARKQKLRLGLCDESVSIVQKKSKKQKGTASTPSVNSHSPRVVMVCGLMIPRGVGRRWRAAPQRRGRAQTEGDN